MATPRQGMRTQQIRIKKEASYGVAPAAVDNRLNAMRIIPHAMKTVEPYASTGDALATTAIFTDDFAEIAASGRLSFTDIMWPLSSILGPPVTSTVDTGVYSHVWTWNGLDVISPASFALHYGNSVRARQILGVIFNTFGFSIARDGNLQMTSNGFGKAVTTGVTGASTPPFAASPTNIPAVPMSPLMFDIYMDDLWADLGDTQIGTIYDFSMAIAERYARTRPIAADGSFDGISENEGGETGQSHTVNLSIEPDATGEALLGDMDASTKKFVRIEANGAANSIATGFAYLFRVDMALFLTGVDAYGTVQGGVHALPYTGSLARDTVSDNGIEITIQNGIAAVT